jgi:c-di-GMP-binding flagellar brake protein YcgR
LGQVIDISQGGVSLFYADFEERSIASPLLTLFVINQDVVVEGIYCRFVSDEKLIGQSRDPSIQTRRCSVQFVALTERQTDELDQILTNHCMSD